MLGEEAEQQLLEDLGPLERGKMARAFDHDRLGRAQRRGQRGSAFREVGNVELAGEDQRRNADAPEQALVLLERVRGLGRLGRVELELEGPALHRRDELAQLRRRVGQ